jgi:hypothetical protein
VKKYVLLPPHQPSAATNTCRQIHRKSVLVKPVMGVFP